VQDQPGSLGLGSPAAGGSDATALEMASVRCERVTRRAPHRAAALRGQGGVASGRDDGRLPYGPARDAVRSGTRSQRDGVDGAGVRAGADHRACTGRSVSAASTPRADSLEAACSPKRAGRAGAGREFWSRARSHGSARCAGAAVIDVAAGAQRRRDLFGSSFLNINEGTAGIRHAIRGSRTAG